MKPRRKLGASLTSYGLIVGLISIVALAVVQNTGSQVNSLFGTTADTLGGVVDETGAGSGSDAEAPDPTPTPTPFNFIIAGSLATVTNQGISVRCDEWNGSVCNRPIMHCNGNSHCDPHANEELLVHGDSLINGWCYVATGDAAASSGGTPNAPAHNCIRSGGGTAGPNWPTAGMTASTCTGPNPPQLTCNWPVGPAPSPTPTPPPGTFLSQGSTASVTNQGITVRCDEWDGAECNRPMMHCNGNVHCDPHANEELLVHGTTLIAGWCLVATGDNTASQSGTPGVSAHNCIRSGGGPADANWPSQAMTASTCGGPNPPQLTCNWAP